MPCEIKFPFLTRAAVVVEHLPLLLLLPVRPPEIMDSMLSSHYGVTVAIVENPTATLHRTLHEMNRLP